jgi:hypothetical protein
MDLLSQSRRKVFNALLFFLGPEVSPVSISKFKWNSMTILALGFAIQCQSIKISKNVLLTQLSDNIFQYTGCNFYSKVYKHRKGILF